jgi:hypothetical protein
MFLVLGPYAMWALLVTVGCAAWAGKVGYDRYRYLDPEPRREVVIGLIIISLLTGIGGVIAAYASKPVRSL